MSNLSGSNYIYQNIHLELVTAPTLSIVSTEEAKNYLKIGDESFDDDLVDAMKRACVGMIENGSGGISICPQIWKQKQTGGVEKIKLLRQPIQGIPTVSYYESFDTVTATNITYSTYFRKVSPNLLVNVDGYFPYGRDSDGYEITFETSLFTASNYTSSSDPRHGMLKTAILRTLAWMYEQREEYVTQIGEGEWSVNYDFNLLPSSIKALVMPLHSGEGLI